MKRSEKQLVIIACVLFALVLVVRVLPMLYGYYRQSREDIALLEERADRLRTLIVETSEWQEREQLKQAEITDLESWVFAGTDPNLISSSLQRSLRQLVADYGLELREVGVARYNRAGKWLLVEQDISFSLDQQQILPFVQALQSARPRLHIAKFAITRNRRQYTGNLTVVGFGRAEAGTAVTLTPSAAPATFMFPPLQGPQP